MINVTKLTNELRAAGITTHGNCNSDGVVWDDLNNEIQDRPDVKAVLLAHDPTPEPEGKSAIETLQEQVAILSKAIDASNLTAEEAEKLEVTK